MPKRLVIGCGNEFRGDDAAGVLVVRKLAVCKYEEVELCECSGEGAALMACWQGFDDVTVVDAAFGFLQAGEIREWDASMAGSPAGWRSASTHSFGVADAIEVGRALELLPKHLHVIAIGGTQFEAGESPSKEVEQAVETIVSRFSD